MEQLIPVVSKLQDVLGAVGGPGEHLDLPQIVVVGGQSSGKSSVLEAIVGRSFLPRGNGIVTRRPLVLQLYNTALLLPHQKPKQDQQGGEEEQAEHEHEHEHEHEETPSAPPALTSSSESESQALPAATTNHDADADVRPGDEWGEFLHKPGRRYYDFTAIRDEIVRETERSVGHDRGISAQPLHLKIFSPKVLHLTMVDLPGIAKVAVGDQPLDIEDQIKEMCLGYIRNPNAIILAVTAGNTDIANSDALKLARAVDRDGDRTIGVLTKLDLMDPGTDASDVLQNKVVPLQRGYIGVVNRGQRDIDQNTSIRLGLQREVQFFRNHSRYRTLLHKCGTANLSKSLNSMLMHHIRDCLPELKSRIMGMMADVHAELEALGSPSTDTSKATLGATMLALLSKFAASFSNCIDGKGSSKDGLEMNELFGGARIGFIFNQVFVRSLMSVQPFDGLTDEEIRTTICNANGTRASLFVPEISFDILARRQISRLEQPGLQCVDLVYNELQRMAAQCEPTEFQRFPFLRERMVEVVSSLLRRCVAPTQLMVSNLIKIELAYINTSHPDFIGGSKAVAKLMERMSRDGGGGAAGGGSSGGRRRSRGGERGGNGNLPTANGGGGSRLEEDGSGTHEDLTSSLDAETGGLAGVPSGLGLPTSNGGTAGGDPSEGADAAAAAAAATNGGIMNYIFKTKKQSNPQNGTRNGINTNTNNNSTTTSTLPSVVQLPQIPDTMRQPTSPTERERVETEIIKSLIESYFAIVRKNFIDLVPKTIMYFLVNHARDALQNELVSQLYSDTMIPELMKEAEDMAQRRGTCQEMRDLLNKALEIVNEVRDFNTFK